MAASLSLVFDYLSGLVVTQGQGAGRALDLFPWQRRFLRFALRPGVHTAALSVARGNGKTGLISALATAYLCGPLAEPRAECVLIASSFDQARLAFDDVLAYLGEDVRSGHPDWRISDSTTRAEATYLPLGTRIKARGSDPRRAHGLRPAVVVCDEPAQWPERTSETMLAALTTALGKIPGSRLIALGTRPADPEHWFQRWLDGECDYAQSHEADPEGDVMSMRAIRAANPSLRYMPMLREAILRDRERARLDASALASYKALRLNMGTADTYYSTVVDADTWRACETGDLPNRDGLAVWGFDLGGTAAMSAIASYWPETGRLEVLAAFPSGGLSLEQRGRRDGVGDAYVDMERRGELFTTPGRTVDVDVLVAEAADRYGVPGVISSDAWRQGELFDGLEKAGLLTPEYVPRRNGPRDGGEDVRRARRRIIEGLVRTPESHLMRRALAGARTKVDPGGNAHLVKHGAGRSSLHRDDAVAATILALAEADRRVAAGAMRQTRGWTAI